ncbi:hypothetical protein N7462_011291 [Penicillium macrosclerotiorum]|uniref:uncharacterized protein n=1 Tax=Penicillium macrosclerotiorum TaxID=303699 RepID=UPI00254793FC|nr:uncharacterized protein N7462_011291 [Penicillium macrosclerotiorum]KAJ5666882.1 hypothetical protein N7462_011291 [Penicillium macrosclerotiorum]
MSGTAIGAFSSEVTLFVFPARPTPSSSPGLHTAAPSQNRRVYPRSLHLQRRARDPKTEDQQRRHVYYEYKTDGCIQILNENLQGERLDLWTCALRSSTACRARTYSTRKLRLTFAIFKSDDNTFKNSYIKIVVLWRINVGQLYAI